MFLNSIKGAQKKKKKQKKKRQTKKKNENQNRYWPQTENAQRLSVDKNTHPRVRGTKTKDAEGTF